MTLFAQRSLQFSKAVRSFAKAITTDSGGNAPCAQHSVFFRASEGLTGKEKAGKLGVLVGGVSDRINACGGEGARESVPDEAETNRQVGCVLRG